MRYSTDENDAGYANWFAVTMSAYDVKVFLDGAEVNDVMTADSDEGMIYVPDKDIDGDFQLDGEVIRMKKVYGVVTFELA